VTKYFCDKCEAEIDLLLKHFKVETIPETKGSRLIHPLVGFFKLLCDRCDPFIKDPQEPLVRKGEK
jgi:hypothetical protein